MNELKVEHGSLTFICSAPIQEIKRWRAPSSNRFALVARGLNDVMDATGPRLADRYHEHILKTPTETRNALLYVIGNGGVHLLRWGMRVRDDHDPFSSLASAELIQPPQCWLLQQGWLGPPA